jgi:hypothetical protein
MYGPKPNPALMAIEAEYRKKMDNEMRAAGFKSGTQSRERGSYALWKQLEAKYKDEKNQRLKEQQEKSQREGFYDNWHPTEMGGQRVINKPYMPQLIVDPNAQKIADRYEKRIQDELAAQGYQRMAGNLKDAQAYATAQRDLFNKYYPERQKEIRESYDKYNAQRKAEQRSQIFGVPTDASRFQDLNRTRESAGMYPLRPNVQGQGVAPGQGLAQVAAQKFGVGLGATPATGPVVLPRPPKINPFIYRQPQQPPAASTAPMIGTPTNPNVPANPQAPMQGQPPIAQPPSTAAQRIQDRINAQRQAQGQV